VRLISFTIEGYRRFVERTSVKLYGDVIALVGPNEAGKSTILRALSRLGDDDPFDTTDKPRRTKAEPKLEWQFELDAEDKLLLRAVPGTGGIERVRIVKRSDGSRAWSFEPNAPRRDRGVRAAAAALVRKYLLTIGRLPAAFRENAGHDAGAQAVLDLLDADIENYPEVDLDELRTYVQALRSMSVDDGGDVGLPGAVHKALSRVVPSRASAANALADVIELETRPSPRQLAIEALTKRVPDVLVFEEEDRALLSEYDLFDAVTNTPAALRHLAALGDLDLKALTREANTGAIADVATRRNACNARLQQVFAENWNQQGIAIQVEVQGTTLHIQATTPEDSGLSDIAERSDGMRWFAALLAYAHGWTNKPILLVDEIERHLHYDAQSDLIGVLSRQEFSSKVIFTTHSFGCLPYDLGTGVRVVQPIDSATSRLENGFWKRGAGFSPLLASMGAAATSFTPTRHAIIAEGPSDAILLPTLLRQATGSDRLGFQVAPGLSSVAAAGIADLDAEAGRVGFIVDGDKGGRAILGKLLESGVSRDRIIVLEGLNSTPLELEDLVARDVYAECVNEELQLWIEQPTPFRPDDVSASIRTSALKQWCFRHAYDPPDKVAIAQRIVDRSSVCSVVATEHTKLLKSILRSVRSILKLTT
jgi:energy-coupling factor transporter ATP-binding protein EcfA2